VEHGEVGRMIVVRNLSVSYGKKNVIYGFNMDARGVTVLVGPNGVGKSTLLRAIAGGIKASGFISIGGKVVLSDNVNLPPEKRDVAYLPQSGGPIPNLTVEESLKLAGEPDWEIIEALGIKNLLSLKGRELSGGQRKKVGLAMILSSKKKAWLLDEPLAGVDHNSRRDISLLIKKLSRKKNATVLWVSHLREALDVADEVVELGR
jgi:ABC-type multidrug transport system ATPase subunit